jgi:rhodanese-related sulfurtransferase
MQTVKELVSDANSRVKTITAEEAVPLLNDANTVFVDLRDDSELARDGKIPGAVHITRGMLEFTLDPTSPYHNPVFSSGKQVLFYCASGGRSALAADTAQNMGLAQVSHLGGGFRSWRASDFPVERLNGPEPETDSRGTSNKS